MESMGKGIELWWKKRDLLGGQVMDCYGDRRLRLKPGGKEDPDISDACWSIRDEEVNTVTRSSIRAHGTNQFTPESIRPRARRSEP